MNYMAESKKLHIVMFPWLAFGHIIPYLELSKLLAQKGHKVSFISTPRNIQRLPKIPPNIAPLINIVSLPLPHEDNLPDQAEATTDVPYDDVPYLRKAFDGLQEGVAQFLEISTPDWIFYDFAPYWVGPIAAKHGISRAFFSIFTAWSLSFIGSSKKIDTLSSRTKPEEFTIPPKWVPFPTNVAYRLYEAKKILNVSPKNVAGVSDGIRWIKTFLGCEMVAIRSCMELEPNWLQLLEELHRKPVLPVGLLPPQVSENHKDNTWLEIVEWFDKQEKGSVVYIAFGTEVTPSQEDFTELAHGLELSGLPFFWVLRKKHGSVGSDSVELPDGFEERVKGRGVVWKNWAPQLKILSHESIGCFLTHCGWSSIIEAIRFARVLVMLPYMGDQGLNARVLEENKVGIEISRNEQDGSFTRNSVAESLRFVMFNEEGRVYREKAMEMSLVIKDEVLQNLYVDKFIGYLLKHRRVSTTQGFEC